MKKEILIIFSLLFNFISSYNVTNIKHDIFEHVKTMNMPNTSLNNVLADGIYGRNLEGLCMLYQLTNNENILQLIFEYIDRMLDLRNTIKTDITFWNNKKEKLWITDLNNLRYAGTENADTYGHILYCTKLILKNKEIHFHRFNNVTYIEKGLYYLNESENILENYFIPNFISENLTQIWPINIKFDPPHGLKNGEIIPWNQQMMFNNALQRLSESLEVLNKSNIRIKYYDSIVQHSINLFMDGIKNHTIHNKSIALWSYMSGKTYTHYEKVEIHALYDIWGLWRGKYRYKVKKWIIYNIANTIAYSIYKENNTFSGCIDGYSRENTIFGPYILYSLYNKDIYKYYGYKMKVGNLLEKVCLYYCMKLKYY